MSNEHAPIVVVTTAPPLGYIIMSYGLKLLFLVLFFVTCYYFFKYFGSGAMDSLRGLVEEIEIEEARKSKDEEKEEEKPKEESSSNSDDS